MFITTLILLLFAALFPATATLDKNNVTSVTDVYPELVNIPRLSRHPLLGGQSLNKRCCLLAVHEALSVINGSVVRVKPSFIHVDAVTLRQGQFPCEARYESNPNGAPEVWVPYKWCASNCTGWELSANNHLNQWVVPLVGFVIPAVVFCLTIPRRYKLSVSDALFDVDLNKICEVPMVPVFAILAGLGVTLDTVIWVAISFAFSGPMLLSGFYEARLDHRLLIYLQEKIRNRRLRPRIRAQILFIILVGNLRMGSGCDPGDERGPAWDDVNDLVSEIDAQPDPQSPISRWLIEMTKVRLRAMLACQYSFGTMTGAPVVFYTAAFIYTTFDIHNRLGDHDTSLALAFGIWWMTIPHLSIIGACLLAGNNPYTLEGIVGRRDDQEDIVGRGNDQEDIAGHINVQEGVVGCGDDQEGITGHVNVQEGIVGCGDDQEGIAGHVNNQKGVVGRDDHQEGIMGRYGRIFRLRPKYVLVFQSRYQPATMWSRGQSKRKWIDELCKEFGLPGLREVCEMQNRDWISVGGGAIFLAFVPSLLAFLQNYFTPRIGIGCRATTVLSYIVFQCLLMLLWIWDLRTHGKRRGPKIGEITLWHLLVIFCGAFAIFIAVGGTLMQIIGVYRNCLCKLNISDWISKTSEVMLSTNSRAHIDYARSTWLPVAITATAFLGVVSYISWWYQRHLRYVFRTVADHFDDEPEQDGE